MGPRSGRQDAEGLRSAFVANREKVRAWTTEWDCPELEWPRFAEVPSPWAVPPDEEEQWLARHAPFLQEYQWLLEPRPRTTTISRVSASWWFGAGHAFESLEIEFRSVADPPYLAEKLALGADAAALEGWRPDDVRAVYAWLLDGLDSRPMHEMVHGNKRSGFILFDLLRSPLSTGQIAARLRMTLTRTTLDGRPLDDQGRPVTG